ncbi:MAG: formate--tetrahydrofolate ligase [Planctomycetota bacterium]|nr:formate--tetrahydrofolate ligase [Planctomycetota bacterium]
MQTDPQLARSMDLEPISRLAARLGIPAEATFAHGPTKAKVDHRLGDQPRPAGAPRPRSVLVTAVSPTPAGEGKTLHTIGLSLALNRIGRKAACAVRQPSMGPVFGVKGGAAGGGASQIVPMEDFNLHLTGDMHAVGAAHNLAAAALDTSLLLDNPLGVDPARITWKRVLDVNDRALRQIEVGLGGALNGVPRASGFEITPASEVMAVLGLATGWGDLRARLGRIVVAGNAQGKAITCEDLGVAGAMAAILRETMHPTLMQTSERTPAFVHAGPFANIAHGNSSIVADRVAARFCDWVVTEAGFGADMGAVKYFDVKCRASGQSPDAAVLVATVRALKVHSGKFQVKPGTPLPKELSNEDLEALSAGCSNLTGQVQNVLAFGIPVVVAINRFPSDTEAEIALVRERALEAGATAAVESNLFAKGGEGGLQLAEAVVAAAESGRAKFQPLYGLESSIESKIETVATRIHGAGRVEYSPAAKAAIAELTAQGFGKLPICIAKTQYSLSHDPALVGRPRDYVFPVRAVRVAAGAGFVVVYAGEILTMPGLGRVPGFRKVDMDAEGRIHGLF